MKTKVSKIIGVVLALATVMALGAGFIPSDTKTAEAAVGTLRFENIPLPKYPSEGGKYTIVPADADMADLGPIAVSPNGQTLFVAALVTDPSAVNTLMKSADGGYTWEIVTAFRTVATAATDNTSIVAVKISPLYATDSTVWVATQAALYQSVDAGTNFVAVTPTLPAANLITSLDVALDKTGRLSEILGTANGFTDGAVFVRSPATTGLGWVNQLITGTRPVVGVAFSSKFASDEGIFAVTSTAGATGQTLIQGAFGTTRLGGGWDNAIGPGTFYFHNGDNITSAMATIAFPDDFDANSLSANIAFVGISSSVHANGTGTTSEESGDVYKVVFQPTRSSTIDMNVRGQIAALQLSATNIMSLDAMGPASAAKIVVGTDKWDTGAANYYWTTYYSTDSGATWLSAREKSATGGSLGNDATPDPGANVQVAMSPADTNIVFASTNGNKTSAVSRSADGGKSFNQISFIEYGGTDGNDGTNFFSITSQASASGGMVINMMTSTGNASATRNGAYWMTTNGGNTWERVWSYANPSCSDQLDRISRTGDNTTFVIDRTGNTFWRSTDGGVSFPRKITGPKAATIAAYSTVDSNTIWVAYSGSPAELWYTTNLGLPWTQMDDNRVITGNLGPGIARSGTYMMLNAGARAFFSSDSGKIFKVLGVADPTTPAGTVGGGVAFDRNFATNKYVYANMGMVTGQTGGGIWRITVNVDDPSSSSYRQIDNIAGSGSGNSALVNPGAGPAFHLAPDNYYVVDTAAVVAGTSGGLWRSVNPDANPDSIYPPRFNSVNTDIPAGYRVTYSSFIPAPVTTFFVKNNVKPQVAAAIAGQQPAYYNQLFALADTLAVGPTLTAPADKATGFGIRLSTTDLTMTGTVTWTPQAGATQYWIQMADDAAFSAIRIDSNAGIGMALNPTGAVVDISNLLPNHTYYWRARANLPFLSPWSVTRSFTTSTTQLIESVVSLEAPVNGATNIGLRPTLAWSRVIGATGYDWEIAKDAAFAVPVERAGGSLAKVNAVVLSHELDYNTTYYWRVRAQLTAKPPTYSDWATGIFTTMAEPAATQPPVIVPTQAPPVVVEVPVPAAIPAYLLWAIVVIGAVLVIAVIVLIVRTRRVP